jgi:hypothetical protein
LFDITRSSRIATLDLSTLPLVGSSACAPQLSPDGQKVSLIVNCGRGIPIAYEFPNEVYIGDLQTSQFKPITDFAREKGNQVFLSWYQQQWLDADTLVIGADYQIGPTPEQHRLVAYDLTTDSLQTLSSTLGSGFAINPVSNQIAVQSGNRLSDEGNIGAQVELLVESVETIQTDATSSVITLSSTCEIEWSPDGAILAVTASQSNCELYTDRVTFINTENEVVHEHTVSSAAETTAYTVPIGWIAR